MTAQNGEEIIVDKILNYLSSDTDDILSQPPTLNTRNKKYNSTADQSHLENVTQSTA